MTVNEVKTSNRLVITNIAKMSTRLTMDRVTHVDPSDADDEGGEDVNPFDASPTSCRFFDTAATSSAKLFIMESRVRVWKGFKKLGDCLMPIDSHGMCNVEYTLGGQSARCAVLKQRA